MKTKLTLEVFLDGDLHQTKQIRDEVLEFLLSKTDENLKYDIKSVLINDQVKSVSTRSS